MAKQKDARLVFDSSKETCDLAFSICAWASLLEMVASLIKLHGQFSRDLVIFRPLCVDRIIEKFPSRIQVN